MESGKLRFAIALLCAFALTGCAHAIGGGTDGQSLRAKCRREAGALVAQPTPSNLAAAALLMMGDDLNPRQSLDLIERAETLAPQRPELVWLHLVICDRLECDAKAQIAAHIQTLDPDNGFAWRSDLEQATSSGSEAAITAAIARIGAGPRMTFYWNQLEVMMVDAFAVANPSQNLVTRGTTAIGMLAAVVIPSFQPMSKACRREQLDLPGRRGACEAMVASMERSSTVITQSFALDLQERWWPAGSPQSEVVRAKRRRLDYLMTTSGRTGWWRMNRDMALRIDAARRTDREEDVELAVIKSLGLPPEPPADWKDALHPG